MCVRRKKIEKSNNKKSTPPKTHHDIHSGPATATTSRPRATRHPTREPIHARFHRFRVCGNRPRTALAIAYGKNGLGRFVPSACSITANGSGKKKKKHHRHQQSSQRPPQGIPLLQSCEVALERVSDPLGARGLYGLGTFLVGESRRYPKNANLTLSCRCLERASRTSIARHTAETRGHRITGHHSKCPPTDPLPACCYRR